DHTVRGGKLERPLSINLPQISYRAVAGRVAGPPIAAAFSTSAVASARQRPSADFISAGAGNVMVTSSPGLSTPGGRSRWSGQPLAVRTNTGIRNAGAASTTHTRASACRGVTLG